MSAWRFQSPAPPSAVLELVGPVAFARRHVLAQARNHDSLAVWHGDDCLAVAMFRRHGWRRVEFALAVSRSAAPRMRVLIRHAQLTLARLAETSIVVAVIHPANRSGQKMARLVGFRPSRLRNKAFWIFRKG